MLEIKSTDKGLLLPRMTQAERDAIFALTAGLVIFNTNTQEPNFFNGAHSWSSTEYSGNGAWYQNFEYGYTGPTEKNNPT